MQSAVLAIVNPSVCVSVRHTLTLCQNDSSYNHAVFTLGWHHDFVSLGLT